MGFCKLTCEFIFPMQKSLVDWLVLCVIICISSLHHHMRLLLGSNVGSICAFQRYFGVDLEYNSTTYNFKAYGIYTFNVVPTYFQNVVPTFIQNVVPTFIPNAVLIHKFLYWLNIIHQCWEYQILLENLVLVCNAQPAFRTQHWANISFKYWSNATFPILLKWREFNFVPMLTWNIDQASKPWSLHKVFD